jgi:hypothetical protein
MCCFLCFCYCLTLFILILFTILKATISAASILLLYLVDKLNGDFYGFFVGLLIVGFYLQTSILLLAPFLCVLIL